MDPAAYRIVERVAQVCHEANRTWCEANDDGSQVGWDEAPDWQRKSAVEGVVHVLEGNGPEAAHESWCASKVADGWTLGDVKDADAKTHPCLVPYDELPDDQRAKDHLFVAIVRALAGNATNAARVKEPV